MYCFPIDRKRAAVMVKRIGKAKFQVIPDGIYAIAESTMVSELPKNSKVVDEEGNELQAAGRFLMKILY